jgi:photosystem II stability/assembly factor-like uncharacterized protein
LDYELDDHFNYEYENGEWVRAKDDTIYEVLAEPFIVSQAKNKILVSCINGIFLSVDSAKSWSKLPNTKSDKIKLEDVAILDNYVFATVNYIFDDGISKYNIETNTWELSKDVRQDTTLELYAQEVEANNTKLFALQQRIPNPKRNYDTLSGGLYTSTDYGVSWEKTLVDSALYSIYASDDIILISTKYGNLLRSEDNGKTWNTEYIGTIILNFTQEAGRILASTNPLGILETTDNGKTWETLSPDVSNSKLYKEGDKYFFLKGRYVYESNLNFTATKKTNLFDYRSSIYSIISHNDTLLATGNFDRGVQYSADLGESWQTYFSEFEERSENVSTIWIKDSIFICSASPFMYISTDYGQTFEYNLMGDNFDVLILDDRILAYGREAASYSKNFGKTFQLLDTSTFFNSRKYKISKIAKTTSEDLLAFTVFDGVYMSEDNGDSWTKLLNSPITDTTFAAIKDFYEFGGNYYAVNHSPAKLFKSTDEGESWREIKIDMFDKFKYFDLLMIDENTLFLTCYNGEVNGIWISTDQGKSWKDVGKELPPISDYILTYRILGLSGQNVFIRPNYRVGQSGISKLYRTTFEKLGIKTSVEENTENNNYLYTFPPYPNPARGEVKVLFYWDINLPMNVEDISIYDLSGKKIDAEHTLSLEKIGNHYGNLVWDCSATPSGIYLINIKHGTEERTVKVMVE